MKGGAWQVDALGLEGNVVAIAPIPDAIPLTPRMGRLVGLFLADGSIQASKVRWTFLGRSAIHSWWNASTCRRSSGSRRVRRAFNGVTESN